MRWDKFDGERNMMYGVNIHVDMGMLGMTDWIDCIRVFPVIPSVVVSS
jgi:hypothetical protein